MAFIKTQFRELRVFYRRELKWPLFAAVVGFFAITLISYFFFVSNTDLSLKITQFFSEAVSNGVVGEDGNISAPLLFLNNLRACLTSVLLGFIPFFFISAIAVIVNAGLIGAILSVYAVNSFSILRLIVFGLLPHGIFELPALFISFASGISLCLTMCKAVVGLDGALIVPKLKNLARVFVINTVPLLILAAAIETWPTPVLFSRYCIM